LVASLNRWIGGIGAKFMRKRIERQCKCVAAATEPLRIKCLLPFHAISGRGAAQYLQSASGAAIPAALCDLAFAKGGARRRTNERIGFVHRTLPLKHSREMPSLMENPPTGPENNHRVRRIAPEPVANLQQPWRLPSFGGGFSLRQISAPG